MRAGENRVKRGENTHCDVMQWLTNKSLRGQVQSAIPDFSLPSSSTKDAPRRHTKDVGYKLTCGDVVDRVANHVQHCLAVVTTE